MLVLRPSRLDDPDALELIERVQRYYLNLYGGTDDDPLVPVEFAAPTGGFLIGYVEDRPVAMGGWTFAAPDDPDDRRAKVRRMYVADEVRRHGYAGVLLDALEADAGTAGATELILTTGRPQVAAVAFYRARGYTDIAAYGFYGDQPGAVFLGKSLRRR